MSRAGEELDSGDTSQDIIVTNRNWSSETGITTEYLGQGNLPSEPSQPKHLGRTDPALEWTQSWQTTVPSGPNAGYAWATKSPFRVDVQIFINTTALASGSAFMNAQTGGNCTAAQLSNLGAVVLAHEQLHATKYHETASTKIASDIEPMVAVNLGDLVVQVDPFRASIHTAAEQASEAIDDVPPQFPCNINWNY